LNTPNLRIVRFQVWWKKRKFSVN